MTYTAACDQGAIKISGNCCVVHLVTVCRTINALETLNIHQNVELTSKPFTNTEIDLFGVLEMLISENKIIGKSILVAFEQIFYKILVFTDNASFVTDHWL